MNFTSGEISFNALPPRPVSSSQGQAMRSVDAALHPQTDPSSRMRILVTDGGERSALAVTRALGKYHADVLVGAETERCLAATSRYCWKSFTYASPYRQPLAFLNDLVDAIRRHRVTILLPMSDVTMTLVEQESHVLAQHTTLPIPPEEAFSTLSDKSRLLQLARTLDVPVPETVYVPPGQLTSVIDAIPEFPVVVKPFRSLVNIGGTWRKTGVHYASRRAELERLYRDIDYLQFPSLIQRRVDGQGQGVFALMDRGKVIALFAHLRLRERPPTGGVSVLCESISLPEPATGYALRLLRHVGWHGVAMVEFKVDRLTGIPMLMEVNCRFWGSLQLAVDAGVNFPDLLCRLAVGQTVPPSPPAYRIGIRSRWLLGDLDSLLARLFKPQPMLAAPDLPFSLRALLDFCRFPQPCTRNEVFRLSDPLPSAFELYEYLAHTLRALTR